DVPQLHDTALVCRGQHPAVGAKRGRPNWPLMPLENRSRLAGRQVPESYPGLFIPRRVPKSLPKVSRTSPNMWWKTRNMNNPGYGLTITRRSQQVAAWGEGHADDRLLVPRQRGTMHGGGRIPQPDGPVVAGRGEQVPVGGKSHGFDPAQVP